MSLAEIKLNNQYNNRILTNYNTSLLYYPIAITDYDKVKQKEKEEIYKEIQRVAASELDI